LRERALAREETGRTAAVKLLVTDMAASFATQAGRFLGEDAGDVELIDL
jgi:hypothetical protein